MITEPKGAQGLERPLTKVKQIPEWLERLGFAVHQLEVALEQLNGITYAVSEKNSTAVPEEDLCQMADTLRHLMKRVDVCTTIVNSVQL